MATKKPTKKTAKKAVKKSSLKPNMLTYNVPDLFCLAMIEDHQGNFHCNMSNVTYPKLIRAVAILKSMYSKEIKHAKAAKSRRKVS